MLSSHTNANNGMMPPVRPGPIAFAVLLAVCPRLATAQAPVGAPPAPAITSNDTLKGVSEKIQIAPHVADRQIEQRLAEILTATGRFQSLRVTVRGGVVFLDGKAVGADDKKWAGDLARNTEAVTAVMNRISITPPSLWDFGPALNGMRELERSAVGVIPFVILAAIILLVGALAAKLTTKGAQRALRDRTGSPLLRDVIARGSGLVLFVASLLLALRVAGLTTIALTVVGGTGVLGIILGIAFRDISENLLASVFLSVQHPFRNGDLIQIEDVTGYVQRLTVRATLLMTLDGNHVQIPNATVYKSIVRNFTSNPNRREDFVIGIGYDEVVADAQAIALKVLAEHPAVLDNPEPWVLVDSLGAATVNLRVYFWLNGKEHSWLKVRSSVIRLIKRSLQDAGVSLPDTAREVVFPHGVPVTIERADGEKVSAKGKTAPSAAAGSDAEKVATRAEAGLTTEAPELKKQAIAARRPEEGEDLLSPGNEHP